MSQQTNNTKQGVCIQQKVDYKANWTGNNPVLQNKEIGYEKETGKYKIGQFDENGELMHWNDLPYAAIGGEGLEVLEEGAGENSIQQKLDSENWSSINARMLSHLESVNYTTEDGAIVQRDENGNFLVGAFGKNSTMMNGKSQTVGDKTHAEGSETLAFENNAHVEGNATYAGGKHSHAEGNETAATGIGSHAEGNNTTAYIDNSHTEGANTLTEVKAYRVAAIGVTIDDEIVSNSIQFIDGTALISDGVTKGMYVTVFTSEYKTRGIISQVINETTLLIDTNDGDYTSLFEYGLSVGCQVLIDGGKYGNEIFDQTKAGATFSSHAEGSGTISRLSAHAEGIDTEANGFGSHAEGRYSISKGEYAHAEGYNTLAGGHVSHAEGILTQANGKNSHAEGNDTKAIAVNSHAEGLATQAKGAQSHAEGYNTTASGGNSHAEGKDTTASGVNSHAEGYGSDASGDGSHAEGINTKASGYSAHSEGENAKASGYAAHAEGLSAHATGSQAHAEGFFTTAKGINSHAEGNTTEAWGAEAHIEGYSGMTYENATNEAKYAGYTSPYTYGTNEHIIDIFARKKFSLAKGDRTHVEGQRNIAIGNFAHAEGVHTQAIGECSHTEGWNTQAHGVRSHAEGLDTVAMGENQHVQGKYNVKDTAGVYAHIVGGGTSGSKRKNIHTIDWNGNAEFAGSVSASDLQINGVPISQISPEDIVGQKTEAGGEIFNDYANNQATNLHTHAEGENTIASGYSSHAEGYGTTASGYSSHTEGYGTTASGTESHAEGFSAIASGYGSHSEGSKTIAAGENQHVQGKYNVEDTENKYAHIVGGGTSDADRKNIHTIDWDGNAWFAGDVFVGPNNYKLINENDLTSLISRIETLEAALANN